MPYSSYCPPFRAYSLFNAANWLNVMQRINASILDTE